MRVYFCCFVFIFAVLALPARGVFEEYQNDLPVHIRMTEATIYHEGALDPKFDELQNKDVNIILEDMHNYEVYGDGGFRIAGEYILSDDNVIIHVDAVGENGPLGVKLFLFFNSKITITDTDELNMIHMKSSFTDRYIRYEDLFEVEL